MYFQINILRSLSSMPAFRMVGDISAASTVLSRQLGCFQIFAALDMALVSPSYTVTQLQVIFSPSGHMAMPGDIFGCHSSSYRGQGSC